MLERVDRHRRNFTVQLQEALHDAGNQAAETTEQILAYSAQANKYAMYTADFLEPRRESESESSPRRRYAAVDTTLPKVFHRSPYESWKIFQEWNPLIIYFFFCYTDFLFHFDMGCWAALLGQIEDNLGLTNIQMGFTMMAYLIGFACFSPFFGYLSTLTYPIKVIGCGIGFWCFSTACVCACDGFFSLFLFRFFAGVGAAAFKSTALTLIDVMAPQKRRSVWIAVFYSVSTCAMAVGNIIGGKVAEIPLVRMYGWRYLFGAEVFFLLPIPIILITMVTGPSTLKDLDPVQQPGVYSLAENLNIILSNNLFLLLVFGYCCQLFVRGQISFYVIAFLKHNYGITEKDGGLYFGLLTICSGFFATNIGGIMLDRFKKNYHFKEDRFYIHLALQICLPLTAIATPFVLSMYFFPKVLFLICLFIAQLTLYAQIGPMTNAIMWCVPVTQRSLATAVNLFVIHSLGDALSPVVTGALIDLTNWTTGLFLGSLSLVISVLFLSYAYKNSQRAVSDLIASGNIDYIAEYVEEDSDEFTDHR